MNYEEQNCTQHTGMQYLIKYNLCVICSWLKGEACSHFVMWPGKLLWTVPLLHWENQFLFNIILSYDIISSGAAYPKLQIYLSLPNLFSKCQVSEKEKKKRKPSIETWECQKTFRSKHKSFPETFFYLPFCLTLSCLSLFLLLSSSFTKHPSWIRN